jgi:hypothetical protein
MKRIVRLTESDLARIVKRVINEAEAGATKGPNPASYGDSLVPVNYHENDLPNIYSSLGSTVTPMKIDGQPGNKIVVNADHYADYRSKKDTQFKLVGKRKVEFVQRCGAVANQFSYDYDGGMQYVSKKDGPIQKKVMESCKTQGYKGEFQPVKYSSDSTLRIAMNK